MCRAAADATLPRMEQDRPLIIDMTAQGEFAAEAAQPVAAPFLFKLGLGAALVAIVAGAVAVAAVFLWVASVLVPVALVATAVAYGAFRFQLWRARK